MIKVLLAVVTLLALINGALLYRVMFPTSISGGEDKWTYEKVQGKAESDEASEIYFIENKAKGVKCVHAKIRIGKPMGVDKRDGMVMIQGPFFPSTSISCF